MPDLWSMPKDRLRKAAKAIYGPAAEPQNLTTGLWVYVKPSPEASEVMLLADHAWRVTHPRR